MSEEEKGKDDSAHEAQDSFPRNADYMIHVFIEKAKDLKTPPGSTIDPMFKIESLGQTEYSETKDDIDNVSEVTWAQHIFLEARNVDKKQANDASISIMLMDKGVFKDALIGQFKFDLSQIYLRDRHVLMHKWLALNNPESEDFSEICGYVKVSINVTATGDKQVEIKEDTSGKEDSDVLMSPSLNPKFFQVKLRILQGAALARMDKPGIFESGGIDAYVKLDHGGHTYRTKQKRAEAKGGVQCGPVNWNEEFWLSSRFPVLEPNITLKLMDYDGALAEEEIVGSINLKTKKLLENAGDPKNKKDTKIVTKWFNIYGAPIDCDDNDASRKMNDNPDQASSYKGRILMQIETTASDKPIRKTFYSTDEVIKSKEVEDLKKNKEYQMIFQIGQAIALPSKQRYKIRVTIGGKCIDFEPKILAEDSPYRRYERKEEKIMLPYRKVKAMGHVIFQLIDDEGRPVCYHQADIKHFETDYINQEYENEGPGYKWVDFLPDKAINQVKQPHMAGIFNIRGHIHGPITDDNPAIDFKKQYKVWSKGPPMRLQSRKIRAYIYQCRNLPAADDNGTADPVIEIWDTDPKEKKTRVVQDTLNPIFVEVKELIYEVERKDDRETWPPFLFDLYDVDSKLFGKEEQDYMGRATIQADNCSIFTEQDLEERQNDEVATCEDNPPKWHPFKFAPGEPASGEVLVQFASVDVDYQFSDAPDNFDLGSMIKRKDHKIEVLILGLRDLQSPGILPVRKAFIEFGLKSMLPANTGALDNKYTQPSAYGPNPTLNNTMEFQIELPEDPLFCPQMMCTVYDNILPGLIQPIIGVFTLPIGQLKQEQEEELEKELSEVCEIIENLQDILAGKEIIPQDYGRINDTDDEFQFDAASGRDNPNYALNVGDIKLKDKKDSKNDRNNTLKSLLGNQSSSGQQIEMQNMSKSLGVNEDDANKVADAQEAQNLSAKQSLVAQIMKTQLEQNFILEEGDEENIEHNAKGAVAAAKAPKKPNKKGKKNVYAQITKKQLEDNLFAAEEAETRAKNKQRKKDQEKMEKNDQIVEIILPPKYELDKVLNVYREVNEPASSLYIGIGWDREKGPTKKGHKKHYRHYYDTELENVEDIYEAPFKKYNLKRGQSRGLEDQSGLFSFFKVNKLDESGQNTTEKKCGYFKGLINILSAEDEEAWIDEQKESIDELKDLLNQLSMKVFKEPFQLNTNKIGDSNYRKKLKQQFRHMRIEHLNVIKILQNFYSDSLLKQSLLTKEKCIVRVYMIGGYSLAQRDNGSSSDPYVELICNDEHQYDRDSYKLDESNPQFNQIYDFHATFPGCSPLTINVWDYDSIFGDDFIGSTLIDLEDRFFSPSWQALASKPVEERKLLAPSSDLAQGTLQLWVEIISTAIPPKNIKKWDISSKPPEEFEVRICVFNCVDIAMGDFEGTSDAYCRGFFDSDKDVQETDTHWRCQDGKPDYQYRLIYDFQYPTNNYKYTLQIYDRDVFSSNDMLGSTQIDLQQIISDSSLTQKAMVLNEKYWKHIRKMQPNSEKLEFDDEDDNTFWLTFMAKDDSGRMKTAGKVRLRVDIVPKATAKTDTVGKARDEPNHSPHLPDPTGRMEFSLNPLKMYEQLIGPEVRQKIFNYLCCALAVIMLIAIAPNVIGSCLVACI